MDYMSRDKLGLLLRCRRGDYIYQEGRSIHDLDAHLDAPIRAILHLTTHNPITNSYYQRAKLLPKASEHVFCFCPVPLPLFSNNEMSYTNASILHIQYCSINHPISDK